MCGIAGYLRTSSDHDHRLDMVISLLGVFMEERGNQSWGWTDGERIEKRVGPFQSGFDHTMLGTKASLLHTRLATFGDKTAENSHPFSIKGMIGVHNGMVYNHATVAKKYDIEYKVDSEIIFHAIADGIPMSELNGYGTIAFFRDGKINLGRFSTRGDLFLANTELGWVWASEKDAVLNAMGIAGAKINFAVETKLGKLYQLDGNQIRKTKQDMTMGTFAPVKGPTSWQDFKGGTYSNGVTSFPATKGGAWDDDDEFQGYGGGYGGWYGKHRSAQAALPLPTAETTTFTAEPSSDQDEVIDVGDGEYMDNGDGSLSPLLNAMQEALADDDGLNDDAGYDYYHPDNFYKTMADDVFLDGPGNCNDCLDILDGDQPVFVHLETDEAFCALCHRRNNEPMMMMDSLSDWERELDEQAMLASGNRLQAQINRPMNSGSYLPF